VRIRRAGAPRDVSARRGPAHRVAFFSNSKRISFFLKKLRSFRRFSGVHPWRLKTVSFYFTPRPKADRHSSRRIFPVFFFSQVFSQSFSPAGIVGISDAENQ